MNGTIVLSLLDSKELPADALEQLRMRVEEVLAGEHGRRLVRQLEGATGLRWTAEQHPRPKGTAQPTQREILEAQRRRQAETAAYFEARKAARAQSGEYTAALRRLEEKGLTGPSQQQVLAEMYRARSEADAALHAAEQTTAGNSTTDRAVARILKRKASDGGAAD